jgi:Icc protein
MKIIHMSDLHITDNGAPIWDTDTLAHFDKVIKEISTESDVDAIFISGDIADNGSIWAYEYVDKAMAKLGIPTYVCPGNHDRLSNMHMTMKYCQMHRNIKIGNWDFIILDSTMVDPDDPTKNRARGSLKDEDLEFIEQRANESKSSICLVMHHSPIEPGGWMNRKLLENRDELKNLISKLSKVKLVLFGHIHYPMMEKHAGTIYSSAPSVGFAFDKDLPKYQILIGNEGYSILHIEGNNVQVQRIKL